MPLVGQQRDARGMTTIGVTSSIHEFLYVVNLLLQRESRRQSCLKVDVFAEMWGQTERSPFFPTLG